MTKFLWIAGCGHTGTTILARVLGAHKKIFLVLEESGCFLANRLFLEDSIINNFADIASAQNKEWVVEKTPRHIWHIDYIRRKKPDSKFLLTTRIAPEVIASLYLRYGSMEQSIERWESESLLTLRHIDFPDTQLIRYEDFISDTQNILNHALDHLELDFDPEMLNYHNSPVVWNRSLDPGVDKNHDLQRNKSINKPITAPEKVWTDRLSQCDQEKIRSYFRSSPIAHKISQMLGYDELADI